MDDYYSFAAFFSQVGRKQTRRLSRNHRLQPRRRRGSSPRRQSRHGAQIPRRRVTPDVKPAKTAAPCSPSGSPPPTTLTSPRTSPTAFGPISSAWALSSRSTTCPREQPRQQPELLKALGDEVRRIQVRLRNSSATSATRNTYQRTTGTQRKQPAGRTNFAHGNVRRIPAESAARLHQPSATKRRTSSKVCPSAPARCKSPTAARRTTSSPPSAARRARPSAPATPRPIPRCRNRCTCSTAPTVEGKIAQGGLIQPLASGRADRRSRSSKRFTCERSRASPPRTKRRNWSRLCLPRSRNKQRSTTTFSGPF
jgi:hypothetical protein